MTRLKDVALFLAAVAVVLAVAGYYTQTQHLTTSVRELRGAQRQIAKDTRQIGSYERELATFGVSAVQQNIRARYDDCGQLNKIRAGLRSTVQQGKVEDPLLYQLVPSLNTPRVRRIVALNDRTELREFARVDCKDYARRAIPPGDHHHYKVP